MCKFSAHLEITLIFCGELALKVLNSCTKIITKSIDLFSKEVTQDSALALCEVHFKETDFITFSLLMF